MGIKWAYTVVFAIWFVTYWRYYGPVNFLYFCDLAACFALAALWLKSPLLASMPAVGILLPQTYWMVDFLAELMGLRLTGMTAYMFDATFPLFLRALSFLLHGCLPILLAWLVARLGYDGRALGAWTVLAWGVVLICYLWVPGPPAPADDPLRPVNVNYVYGFSSAAPQNWIPQNLYVLSLLVILPAVVFLPTHLILLRLFGRPAP